VRIGLAYDLRDEYLAAGFGQEETAEFDQPGTIAALEGALRELGHDTERVGHLRELVRRLAAGARWDLVFNVAEGLSGFGREAQVPALLEAFGIPYTFSDPLVSALTLHKAMAKRVLRDLGLPTPDFRLVECEADLAAVDLPFPLFVKPVAEGTAKGIDEGSRVTGREALAARCRQVLARWSQPALVEPYLPGRELTVAVLGTGPAARAIGTLEVRLRAGAELHSYTWLNKEESEERIELPLAAPADAAAAEPLALAAWRGLGGRDAGRVDLRADAKGALQILEVNPLPGLHPTHSDLPMLCTARGIAYRDLVGAIVDSARERVPACETREARRPASHRALAPPPP
jgi:D-alanine-D-alanine ligase